MYNPIVYCNVPSTSARMLAKAMGAERTKILGPFLNNPKYMVVNWGVSGSKYYDNVLNSPGALETFIDKRKMFIELSKNSDVRQYLPEWTTNPDEAYEWSMSDPVFCRKLVASKGGAGITITKNGIVDNCPLYTKAFSKTAEYRVHIVRSVHNNDRFNWFWQKKRLKEEVLEDQGPYGVWNHGNGYRFGKIKDPNNIPEIVRKAAATFTGAAGALDFFALDMGYNRDSDKCIIFESNHRPGLGPSVLEFYKTELTNLMNQVYLSNATMHNL